MWHPFKRKPIRPILVAEATAAPVPSEDVQAQIEQASMTALARREDVRMLSRQIHETLAAGALLEIRGGRP